MKKYKKEIFGILLLIFIYIFLRSLHFPQVFNFSSEQASFATKALELWKNHKIEFIGPPISWRYEGRYFFQGSLTYYAMMPFLILGHWDPMISTYLMVLFGAIMMIILYTGVSSLINKKTAFIITFLFATLPFYIDYSRFFWNPTLQFLFTPLVILWMGLFKKYRKTIFLFLVSFTSGVLMLFHYQFLIVIIGLIIYYFFVICHPDQSASWRRVEGSLDGARDDKKMFVCFLLGFPLGFSPMIIFELRNHFYNLQTLWLFFTHAAQVFPQGGGVLNIFTSYYMLCPSLFLIIFLLKKIRVKNTKVLLTIGAIIILYSLHFYIPIPTHAFGMARDWNYLMEKKAYDIIRSQKVENFNVVNLGYDTVASVQKYFLIRDNIKGVWEDYYHNKYLFLISYPQDYMKNSAYEINTFTPNKVIKRWRLNSVYEMLLLERIM